MPGCFSVMPGFFFLLTFHFLLFFVILLLLVTFVNYFFTIEGSLFVTCYFFTACNFYKLLFTIERGQGNCCIIFIHCSRGGGVP
jgi:hypothetical protein